MIKVLAHGKYAVMIEVGIGDVTFTEVTFFNDLGEARHFLRRSEKRD